VRIFGVLHLSLLAAIAVAAFVLSRLCRRGWLPKRAARLTLGWALASNEIVWWTYRYSHEGIHLGNLPLQLCDLTLWVAVLACLTLSPPIVEFTYFAGLAGAGMALLTPDLWSPWPSYPAIYFFLGHGGIVIAAVLLVFGGIASLRPGAWLRVFGSLLGCAAVIGAVNAALGANYAYLCHKPAHARGGRFSRSTGEPLWFGGGGRRVLPTTSLGFLRLRRAASSVRCSRFPVPPQRYLRVADLRFQRRFAAAGVGRRA
jgi:hypothetical integral membrane protein (TIGR02206 family)